MNDTKTSASNPFPYKDNPSAVLLRTWLEEDRGRAEFFAKIDPALFPSMISKMKRGVVPITFEYAVRLERAQKPSPNPLKAERLMTFLEHRTLYRYASGQEAAPPKIVAPRRPAVARPLTPASEA